MQRVSALWQASPRKLVSALFILSLAAMMAVASGASFTSTSANAGNVVTAGILSHGNSTSGAILTVDKLTPGDTATGYTNITNTGDVSGDFTLTKSIVSDTPLATPFGAKLDLVIDDLGDPSAVPAPAPVNVYTGKLSAMGARAAGTLAAGDVHRYRFTVSFPDSGKPSGPTAGDNRYQGGRVEVDYNWEAVTP